MYILRVERAFFLSVFPSFSFFNRVSCLIFFSVRMEICRDTKIGSVESYLNVNDIDFTPLCHGEQIVNVAQQGYGAFHGQALVIQRTIVEVT